MPVSFAAAVFDSGFSSIPYAWTGLKVLAALAVLWAVKTFSGGARNTSERLMHSKVVMITGGTSGVGAAIALQLATRGAQLILLTQHPLADPFLVDYIEDLRERTNNELITAEQVDLTSLYSIRRFATKWVDNAPPRRLDLLILCASTMTPRGGRLQLSEDGVESVFAVNYLANFHLLSILSPALRAQPPDRDVRVLVATCSSYMGGKIPSLVPKLKTPLSKSKAGLVAAQPSASFAASKLALMVFAQALQKHLSAYVRPDKQPMNARVVLVDPGWCRTPGMRRFLTLGYLWGLALYLLTWPFWWLVLKSPEQGAQSFLYAAMEADFGRGPGGRFIKECMDITAERQEINDEEEQQKLWQMSEKAIEALEKESAVRRAAEKKNAMETANNTAKATGSAVPSQPKEKQTGSRRSRKVA